MSIPKIKARANKIPKKGTAVVRPIIIPAITAKITIAKSVRTINTIS